MNDLATQFGKRLADLMAKRGLTADGLVRRSVGISGAAVTKWLRGERFPRPRALVDVARALGITPAELLAGIPVMLRVKVEVDAIIGAEAGRGE